MKKCVGMVTNSPTLLARAVKYSSVPLSVMNEVKMLSGVTNDSFSPRCQAVLREVAAKRRFTSQYWVTQPQSRRTGNALILPGEQPSTVYLNVEKVVPLKALPKAEQKRILDEFPPFFGTGVGILSDRMKWRAVTAERLIRLLSGTDDERALFIDVSKADALNIKYNAKDVIDVRSASSIVVYNADQLDDPYKGQPPKGVAFDVVTGKRIGQPAHDILLGVGILRGYTSPMWIAEPQLRYLNLELRPHAHHEAVPAANMTGMIVPLSAIPMRCGRELLKELKAKHPDAFGHDVFFLYNVNGWEATRSRVLVKNMAAIDDKKYPFHFVNLDDLVLQKPQYAKELLELRGSAKPIGSSVFDGIVNETTVRHHVEARLAVQTLHKKLKFFFAQDATLRRYYNALCMKEPYLAVPSVRPIAIVNGRLLGRRDEGILRQFALEHKLSSPLWVSETAARRLGVHIARSHLKDFVQIGASAAEVNPDEDGVEGFYNVEDFTNMEEILSLFPKASKSAHFMLDSKWRPVLGKQRQEFLGKQNRRTPLWVSVNECLMSGFEPRPGTKPLQFPVRKAKSDNAGVKLYNSQHTTDPVRVIGLSTVFTRPQGTSL